MRKREKSALSETFGVTVPKLPKKKRSPSNGAGLGATISAKDLGVAETSSSEVAPRNGEKWALSETFDVTVPKLPNKKRSPPNGAGQGATISAKALGVAETNSSE